MLGLRKCPPRRLHRNPGDARRRLVSSSAITAGARVTSTLTRAWQCNRDALNGWEGDGDDLEQDGLVGAFVHHGNLRQRWSCLRQPPGVVVAGPRPGVCERQDASGRTAPLPNTTRSPGELRTSAVRIQSGVRLQLGRPVRRARLGSVVANRCTVTPCLAHQRVRLAKGRSVLPRRAAAAEPGSARICASRGIGRCRAGVPPVVGESGINVRWCRSCLRDC